MNDQQLIALGLTDAHIASDWPIHKGLVQPWLHLRSQAFDAGFDMVIASGFRSFDRQLAIWNAKCQGLRPILDSDGMPLVVESLGVFDKILAILRWSALPGASRHHWGTDIDIYDAKAVNADYPLQLTVDEYVGAGPFAKMTQWLDQWLASPANPGFFKPYDQDRGGVHPEPWHLSYWPLANQYAELLTTEVLAQCLQGSEVQHCDVLLERLDEIFQRFVQVPV